MAKKTKGAGPYETRFDLTKMKNTFVDVELETGETVKATLSYICLLELKNARKAEYERYAKVMTRGIEDGAELDMLTVVYTGYLCALIAEGGIGEDAMDYEEFISCMSPDREYLSELFVLLTNPKKAKASEARS